MKEFMFLRMNLKGILLVLETPHVEQEERNPDVLLRNRSLVVTLTGDWTWVQWSLQDLVVHKQGDKLVA